MTATILIVILWFTDGSVRADATPIPDGISCPDIALAYIKEHVTGNANVIAMGWSCQDVEGTKESGG